MKVKILPSYFLNSDGTFNKDEAIKYCARIAGICYSESGFNKLLNENETKTLRRASLTLNNGHHSVYDHVVISFNLESIPKMLAMVLNNEKEYITSEKSLRYTKVNTENKDITKREVLLYNKWVDLFKVKIKNLYRYEYNDFKIEKLAMENARYLLSVFTSTEMIYSTTLRQINYIASWMLDYINNIDEFDNFQSKLALEMKSFISELEKLNVLDERLMENEKNRKLSLFGSDLVNKEEYFKDTYSTKYKTSFSSLAQAQRHRTLDYEMELLKQKEYFIPPIISDDDLYISEWLQDMKMVKDNYPQGELVLVNEKGKYEDFILKCKERLCSNAQLEIMKQTRETLIKYMNYLERENNPLKDEIVKYSYGPRCTFLDYTCKENCGFSRARNLNRRV